MVNVSYGSVQLTGVGSAAYLGLNNLLMRIQLVGVGTQSVGDG